MESSQVVGWTTGVLSGTLKGDSSKCSAIFGGQIGHVFLTSCQLLAFDRAPTRNRQWALHIVVHSIELSFRAARAHWRQGIHTKVPGCLSWIKVCQGNQDACNAGFAAYNFRAWSCDLVGIWYDIATIGSALRRLTWQQPFCRIRIHKGTTCFYPSLRAIAVTNHLIASLWRTDTSASRSGNMIAQRHKPNTMLHKLVSYVLQRSRVVHRMTKFTQQSYVVLQYINRLWMFETSNLEVSAVDSPNFLLTTTTSWISKFRTFITYWIGYEYSKLQNFKVSFRCIIRALK